MKMKNQDSPSEMSIAEMFDRIAFRYDFLNALLSMKQDRRWRRILASWLPQGEQGSLLDVACGTGDVLQTVMQRRKNFTSFVGVDISKEMLKLAEKKLGPEVQAPSLVLKPMSAEALNFPPQSFDALTISFGLRNVHDKEKALREFHRVLKTGASLLVLEFFQSPPGLMNRLFRFYFHVLLPWIGGIFSDKKAYAYLPRSVENFYTVPEFTEVLQKNGFELTRKKVFLWGACVLVEAKKTH